MDLDRLRLLVAAPMAGLFLILSLCAFVMQRPASVGMWVPMLRVREIPDYDCPGVDRTIVVRLLKSGIIKINETDVLANELRARLAEIYENRQEKILPVYSDPEVSFGDFATFYANVVSSTSDLHIILRTRQLDAQLEQCSPYSSCGLDWPDHSYLPCVYRNVSMAPVRILRHSRH
jgi:biopolymer transport protein ExbD